MSKLSPLFIEKANARRAKRSIEAQQREKQAVELHEQGHSFQAIGDILGVSRQFAHVIIRRAYARKNSEMGISTGTD